MKLHRVFSFGFILVGIAAALFLNEVRADELKKISAKFTDVKVLKASHGIDSVRDVQIILGTLTHENDTIQISYLTQRNEQWRPVRIQLHVQAKKLSEDGMFYSARAAFPPNSTCPVYYSLELTEKDLVWKGNFHINAPSGASEISMEGIALYSNEKL